MATVYIELSPLDAIPATRAGHASLDVTDGTGTGNPQIPKLLFDAATNEVAHFRFRPRSYGTGNWTVEAVYAMATATSGDVVIGARIRALTPADAQDVDADAFATANTATGTVAATAGYVKALAITLSNLDAVASGDDVVLEFYRDAAAAGDTAAGDLELLGLTVSYSDV